MMSKFKLSWRSKIKLFVLPCLLALGLPLGGAESNSAKSDTSDKATPEEEKDNKRATMMGKMIISGVIADPNSNRSEKQSKIHIIKAGETFSSIAQKYKCTVAELKKANPDLKERALPVGGKMLIPPAKEDKKSEDSSKKSDGEDKKA